MGPKRKGKDRIFLQASHISGFFAVDFWWSTPQEIRRLGITMSGWYDVGSYPSTS